MSRRKTPIPGMMPTKEWLSKGEAMSYLDLNEKDFDRLAIKNSLTASSLTGGKKLWFKVSELDSLFEKHIIVKQVD